MRIDDSSIRVNRHTCIACGVCVDRCIMDNLRLSVAPCRQACPLGMNCQGYIRLIALGREEEAVLQLLPFGPLVTLIAETCDAPCERACFRSKKDGAVHILALKRYLAQKYSDQLDNIAVPKVLSGKRLGIIGLGVSGLSCGFKAIQAGHSVTLYAKPSDDPKATENPGTIITALGKAGALFLDVENLQGDPGRREEYDAIILSGSADRDLLGPGVMEKVANTDIDPVSHLIQDNIFCVAGDAPVKGAVFEMAAAFETMESVNRFLNREPFDWGRGFYTQDGAVKAYQPDTRVGSAEGRTPQEELAQGFDRETAQKQASRCFGCGRAFEKNQTCWYCLPCELECPQEALKVEIPYLVR